MNVKRYIANDMPEALSKIRDELGRDAFILNQRTIRHKGLRGFFRKPMVEVVAAYEPPESAAEPPAKKKKPNPLPPLTPQLKKTDRPLPESDMSEAVPPAPLKFPAYQGAGPEFKPVVLPGASPRGAVAIKPPVQDDSKIASLETKIEALAATVQNLTGAINSSREAVRGGYPAEVDSLLGSLLENEVHEEFAHKIAREVTEIVTKQKANPVEVMEQILRQTLGEPAPLRLKRFKRTVVMLVGSTGVGKTTTLAKLAAIYHINHHAKVGIITTDTYRIAAVDQLRTYAEILEVPLSVVYGPDELPEALREHEDKDVVFIDTAGKSPKDRTLEEEITSMIKLSDCDEVHLVLSATTGFAGLLNIITTYGFLKDYKILFTKMDENPAWGVVLNTKFLTDKPISFIGSGQTVPDDIEVMNPRDIIQRLTGKPAG